MLSRRKRRNDFEHTALPHMNSLYGAAYRLTRNPRDAEDLVQDAMLRAYRFWDSFQENSNCKAWLFRILSNTFINHYQKKKRTREVLDAAIAEQSVMDGVLVQEHSVNQRDPEGILLDSMLSDDVTRALDALPDDFRMAVVLCDIEGFSYKEIAEIMDCPVGTVMSRLHRGRRQLANGLREFAVSEGIIRADTEDASQANSKTISKSSSAARAASGRNAGTIDLATYRKRKKSTSS